MTPTETMAVFLVMFVVGMAMWIFGNTRQFWVGMIAVIFSIWFHMTYIGSKTHWLPGGINYIEK